MLVICPLNQIFVKERSRVGRHIYDDVLPCLDWLRSIGLPIGVLTNGNADLGHCEVMSPYITHCLSASDVGALKPSPVPFIAIAQRAGVVPSRVLFIGDSYEKDVLGARNAGKLNNDT
jgi:putative hydrolase of the HAD superfamily